MDQYTRSLDNLTAAWLPDLFYAYGNDMYNLKLGDTRTIMHDQRFMLTNNILDPKVYQVTKVVDLNPSGIIKLSIKQDELNRKKDNVKLRICDYYTESGDLNINVTKNLQTPLPNSYIRWLDLNNNGELEPLKNSSQSYLHIGKRSYFEYTSSDLSENINWDISIINTNNTYSEKEASYYNGLIKLILLNNKTLCIKPGKAKSLVGKKFLLSVKNNTGVVYSSIELEVNE